MEGGRKERASREGQGREEGGRRERGVPARSQTAADGVDLKGYELGC